MDLPSFLSYASEPRGGGIALSSALLAVPALGAFHPMSAILLAAVVVGTAVFVERRAQLALRSLERSSSRLTLLPRPARSRPPQVAPQARWEIVERDGRRSLSMRWS